MGRTALAKSLKLAHVAGATGFCAALLALLVLHASLPDPRQIEQFAMLRIAMGNVASWLLLPSMLLVVVSGLISMAASEVYKNAGWVWLKLATGVLVLEGTLVYVQGPMERAGREGLRALAGEIDPATLATTLAAERNSIWIILGVAAVNVVLAIYRPKLSRRHSE